MKKMVHVVMGNDFPEAVFTSEAEAQAFCAARREMRPGHRVRIHWRVYNFELDKETK